LEGVNRRHHIVGWRYGSVEMDQMTIDLLQPAIMNEEMYF